MLAAGPGHLWYAKLLDNGWAVRIDHHDWAGFPLNTVYLHMSSINVPEWSGAGGMYIPAGYPIGIVGDGKPGSEPTGVTHCHFEMLDYSTGSKVYLDPAKYTPVFSYGMIPR
jgi:murein DD-endopeptidase MepM/ murein hydrolase activator NlpD